MKFTAIIAAVGAATAHSIDHVAERQAFVDAINKVATTWKATVEHRFKGEPMGAFKSLLGVKQDNGKTTLAALERGDVKMVNFVAASIPESFDSATNWPQCGSLISTPRDQSNCGCCWAFGTAKSFSDRACIQTNGAINMPFSAEDVCFNSNFNGCGGGQTYSAFSYMKRTGVVTGGQYHDGTGYCSEYSLPHCHHHGPQGNDPYPAEGAPGCPSQRSPRGPKNCDATATGNHTNFEADKHTFVGEIHVFQQPEAIQTAIMTDGPVATAFTVYSDFENYESGVYQHTTGQMEGGHAVTITGWGVDNGVKYWTVQNSWNPYWGEGGNFRIIRGVDECGIESGAIAPTGTFQKKH